MKIQKVGVVGCGLMGHGVVQVAAQGGCSVVAFEADQAALDRGLARVDKSLNKMAQKMVEKGKLEVLQKVVHTRKIEELTDARASAMIEGDLARRRVKKAQLESQISRLKAQNQISTVQLDLSEAEKKHKLLVEAAKKKS